MEQPGSETFEFIRDMLGSLVPFATHSGVVVNTVGDGTSTATLRDEEFTKNHVGTQHAGALFTVAEAASGAAMAGALAPVVAEARSVVKQSTCRFVQPAHGPITAIARTEIDPSTIRSDYDEDGRASFRITVDLCDAREVSVAVMEFEWVVRATT